MVDNPLSYPEYIPALVRVSIVLLVLLVGAVWRSYQEKKRGRHSEMLIKILTVLWVAPILITSLFSGESILILIVAILLFEATREYANLVQLQRSYFIVLAVTSFIVLGFAGSHVGVALAAAPYAAFIMAALVPIISGRTEGAHRQVGSVIFGVIYISVPLSLIVYIQQSVPWGIQFLVVIGCTIAFADAGAFIVGSWLKGPRLAPRVSPAKTWSGAAGALVGAGIGLVWLWDVAPANWTLATAAVMWPLVAVSAMLGDLVESFTKRDFVTKDAGTVLAGFGGVLDRFDSIFLAIPIAYIVLRFF